MEHIVPHIAGGRIVARRSLGVARTVALGGMAAAGRAAAWIAVDKADIVGAAPVASLVGQSGRARPGTVGIPLVVLSSLSPLSETLIAYDWR